MQSWAYQSETTGKKDIRKDIKSSQWTMTEYL